MNEHDYLSSPGDTQVELATAALRRAIVAGDINPGEHVREQDLAASLGMSRTPVREAVRRLVGEGVLVQVPNRGATVAQWTDRDVEEIFQVRAMLEGYAAGLAAQRPNDLKLGILHQLCDEMQDLEARRGTEIWDDYAVLNDTFHRELYALSENHQLCTTLGSLLAVPLMHRSFKGHSSEAMTRSNRQHEDILAAISAGDQWWAQSAMQAHVHATRQLLLRTQDSDELNP